MQNQILVILKKNFLVSFRDKDYITELSFPLIGMVLIILTRAVGKDTTNDGATYQLTQMTTMMLGFAIIGVIRTLIFNFVAEKQERFKETQKIMGAKQSAYTIAWIITAFIKGSIVAFFFVGVVGMVGGFDGAACKFVSIFLAFFLYAQASIAQTFFFSTLYSKASVALDITFLVQIFASMMYNLAQISDISGNKTLLCILSIFPQFSIQLGLYSEGWNGTKYTFYGQKRLTNYDIWTSVLMSSIMIMVYYIFYFYLDQTLKNEYGTQKPHFWFLRGQNSKNQMKKGSLLQNIDIEDNLKGDFSSAEVHEKLDHIQKLQPTVFVRGLMKQFPKLTAVNNLSLSLYPNQIFCLLGHNGAGKTTTISMLTGLIEKSGGKILVENQDLDENLDEIRKSFGLCLQRDVLYEKLTPEEHLRFIGELKGSYDFQLKEEIEDVIEKCGLQRERKKQINELSGGSKRKVSLAMALIGESKIIFLDEPSSGLDPGSRRSIWKILKDIKKEGGRTIVLTTHHMEEAEYLADRVGVMAHGKLLTLGTSDFIKKTFGIGYNFRVSNKVNEYGEHQDLSQEQILWIDRQVKENIVNAKSNFQAPKGSVAYTLPFDKRGGFQNLFRELEQDSRLEIFLELNSLEDAFVNIGMDKDDKKNKGEYEEESVDININDQQNIQPPDSIQNRPQYSFITQFYPMFTRKLSIAFKSFQVVIALILPVFFLLGSVTIAKIVYSYVQSDNEKHDPGYASRNGGASFWQGIMVSQFFVLAYVLNSSSYCGTVASEREGKLIYALNVMGLKAAPYWIGTFCFDILMFLVTCMFFCVMLFAFQIDSLTENFGKLVVGFVLFGFCMIQQNYLCSFLFEKGSSAFKFIIGINYLFLYIIPLLIVFVVKQTFIQQLFSLMTPYTCVQFTFYNLIPDKDLPDEFGLDAIKPFKQAYYYWISMCIQGLLYGFFTILIDVKKATLKNKMEISEEEIRKYKNTIPNIVEEDMRIQKSRDTIRVQNLFKKYDNGFLAIKNTSLSVDQGQIFGLLGPNGAGKSTTFNILTSLIPKTMGKVIIGGQEITSGDMDIYSQVGITPQFDPLWGELTVRQHMDIFGRIKGLQGKQLQEQIEYYSKIMQLENYMGFKSKTLSGGNKRKLCVTMALIGGSTVQFFDEPSTGVDPIAQRFLLNTLSQSLKNRDSSIVLTTHSMGEAESLCTRIGIQINGRLQCVGTPAELKKKYGSGYNVEVFLKEDDLFLLQNEERYMALSERYQKVLELVLEKFPQAKLMEEGNNNNNRQNIEKSEQFFDEKQMRHFIIKLPYEGFSFYKTYDFFMNSEGVGSFIKDFGISQSSLEQIFLYMSQFQKSSDEVDEENDFRRSRNSVVQASRVDSYNSFIQKN